jgi:ankyrin repeat protein
MTHFELYFFSADMMCQASKDGNVTTLRKLIEGGSNINSKLDIYESTPLHYTSYHGRTDATRLLMSFGANVNATNRDLKTPLHVAASNGFASTIRCLVKGGGNLTMKNCDGQTPLDCAEQWGNTETSAALKQIIADLEFTRFKKGWKNPDQNCWRVQSANRLIRS